MVLPRTAIVGLLLAAALVLPGCGDQYGGRMPISGSVTLEGQPLDVGTIIFEPLEKGPTRAQGEVKSGQFSIPRESGLTPGKYLVRLTAGDGKTPTNEEAAGPGGSTNIISVDRIPEDWNVNSKHEVEVKADGSNTFEFPIPNANPKARKR
jgi:hypothetical protein